MTLNAWTPSFVGKGTTELTEVQKKNIPPPEKRGNATKPPQYSQLASHSHSVSVNVRKNNVHCHGKIRDFADLIPSGQRTLIIVCRREWRKERKKNQDDSVKSSAVKFLSLQFLTSVESESWMWVDVSVVGSCCCSWSLQWEHKMHKSLHLWRGWWRRYSIISRRGTPFPNVKTGKG